MYIKGVGIVKTFINSDLSETSLYFTIEMANGTSYRIRDALASNPFNFSKFNLFINKEVSVQGKVQGKFLLVTKMSLRK